MRSSPNRQSLFCIIAWFAETRCAAEASLWRRTDTVESEQGKMTVPRGCAQPLLLSRYLWSISSNSDMLMGLER